MAKKKTDDITRRQVVQIGAATAVAAAVVTKACGFCATQIPLAAKRCPNCTSQL